MDERHSHASVPNTMAAILYRNLDFIVLFKDALRIETNGASDGRMEFYTGQDLGGRSCDR